MVTDVTELTPQQETALQIAHTLADLGVPLFAAHRNHGDRGPEFHYPDSWPTFRAKMSHLQIEQWRPGMALCMVTGVVFDVLDVDPRNGGQEGIAELAEALGWDAGHGPIPYGQARTPSGGEHNLIGLTGLAKGKAARGVDLQAGERNGEGRGFVFIAPTERISKYGPNKDHMVQYEWTDRPRTIPTVQWDAGLDRLAEHLRMAKPIKRAKAKINPLERKDLDADPFWDEPAEDWTPEQATVLINAQVSAVQSATVGEVNNVLGGAARVLGRFVAGEYLDEDRAVAILMDALETGGVHSDKWNVDNRKGWTANTVILAGLANGAEEPWTVSTQGGGHSGTSPLNATATPPMAAPSVDTAPGVSAGSTDGASPTPAANPTPEAPASVPVPRLCITSAADMAYWLQAAMGVGSLAGFFTRDGRVVHTPRVDELGYVEARGEDDANGPASIQAVSAGTLTAKIQYAHQCYKIQKGKDGDADREVSALFPLEAAKRAVDAPEAMTGLRRLAGITLTPMVRADGSVLGTPGYDAASGYLFLPGQGVRVAPVPDDPGPGDLQAAMGLLGEMLAGFPWETKDDHANFLGLLLTPMLRLVTPPTYKMFGIGAHQPGSGKTLLADIATVLHGGVLRSESPGQDEPEWRKVITTILSTTSAPVVLIDNVTGVLKSSTLAGTLTAGQAVSDRVLGKNEMVTTVNDRVWVVTGNNLSLGGDLVRRTIIITIDPNMANPETREFGIADLKGWTAEHRNELLWALLVMIRTWVAAGRPLAERAQSDSFAVWEATVAGILNVCGVAGSFDDMSGKRAAAGGDDDGLAAMLERIWERRTDKGWTVAAVLAPGADEWAEADRDWLPGPVLDKLARSEAAGRVTFGWWLKNRLGRWVTGSDGHSYVIRDAGYKEKHSAVWKVERTA